MATNTLPKTLIAFPYSGDYRIDVLIEGRNSSWNPSGVKGANPTVTFSYATGLGYIAEIGSVDDRNGFALFTTAQKSATELALAYIQSLVQIQFTEVKEGEGGTGPYGQLRLANNIQGKSSGYAYMPNLNPDPTLGDVFISASIQNSSFALGSDDYDTLLHEISHAIGLKHPGNYNAGEAASTDPGNYLAGAEDNTQISLMSYVTHPQGLSRADFGPWDLLALGYLYGLKPQNVSDNVYTLTDDVGKWLQTLIDDGGHDGIDLSAITTPTVLKLVGGQSSSLGTVGGVANRAQNSQNNLQIAFGTEIEDVIGSPQADQIQGSAVDNVFAGRGGNDELDAGFGRDTAVYRGSPSQYTISFDERTRIITLTDSQPGRDGTDLMRSVETLRFESSSVNVLATPASAADLVLKLHAMYGLSAPTGDAWKAEVAKAGSVFPAVYATQLGAQFANLNDAALVSRAFEGLGIVTAKLQGELASAIPTVLGEVVQTIIRDYASLGDRHFWLMTLANLYSNLEADPIYGNATSGYVGVMQAAWISNEVAPQLLGQPGG